MGTNNPFHIHLNTSSTSNAATSSLNETNLSAISSISSTSSCSSSSRFSTTAATDVMRLNTPVAMTGRPAEGIDFKFPRVSHKNTAHHHQHHHLEHHQIIELQDYNPHRSISRTDSISCIQRNSTLTSTKLFSPEYSSVSQNQSIINTSNLSGKKKNKIIMNGASSSVSATVDLSKFTMHQNVKLQRMLTTLEDIDDPDYFLNEEEQEFIRRYNIRSHTSFEVSHRTKHRKRRGYFQQQNHRSSDTENDGFFITQVNERSRRSASAPLFRDEMIADEVIQQRKQRLESLLVKEIEAASNESVTEYIRPKTIDEILKSSNSVSDSLTQQTSSSYSKSKNRRHLADQLKRKKKNDKSVEELERKLNEYRTNEKKMNELSDRVALYKQQIQIDRAEGFGNKIKQNKRKIGQYYPDIKKKKIEEKAEQLNHKIVFAQAKRDELERSFKERTLLEIDSRKERRDERDLELIVSSYVGAWLTIVYIVKALEAFESCYEKMLIRRKQKQALEQYEQEMERQRRRVSELEEERRQEFKINFKPQLQVITKRLLPGIMRWRIQRQKDHIPVIRSFLNDLHETFRIPLAMSRFKNAVLRIQKFYRERRVKNSARILLIKLQVDHYIENKIASLDKRIEIEKKRIHNVGQERKKGMEVRPTVINNSQMSLKYLMNTRGFSDKLYELVAKREELKRIDTKTRITFIREDNIVRKKIFQEQMKEYHVQSQIIGSEILNSNTSHHTTYVLPKKPHLQLLLDSISLTKLVDKMWNHSKQLIMEQKHEAAENKKKRAFRYRPDFSSLFSRSRSPSAFKSASFITASNFEYIGSSSAAPNEDTTTTDHHGASDQQHDILENFSTGGGDNQSDDVVPTSVIMVDDSDDQ